MNPLNAEHYRKIRGMLRKLDDLQPVIEKMERCGLNCADQRETAERFRSILTAIETEFFADGIPA